MLKLKLISNNGLFKNLSNAQEIINLNSLKVRLKYVKRVKNLNIADICVLNVHIIFVFSVKNQFSWEKIALKIIN